LPDLTAYLKVSGAYPVAKVKIPYVARPDIAAAYEPRALPTIEARDPLELANEAAAVAAELDAAEGFDAVPLEHERGGLF
jgi:type IV secretory pathway TraG/TraD family ATPase VirD4